MIPHKATASMMAALALFGSVAWPRASYAQGNVQMCIARVEQFARRESEIITNETYACLGAATGASLAAIRGCFAVGPDPRAFAACIGGVTMAGLVAIGKCYLDNRNQQSRLQLEVDRQIDACRQNPGQ